MIYPVIVLAIASIVVALVTIFLLPRFAMLLKDIAGNIQLPLASRILMGISSFVQVIGWWLIPAVMVATPFVLIHLYKTKGGKEIMDRIALRLPVFGKLCRILDMSRFARTLSVLLDAGVDVGQLDRPHGRRLEDEPDPQGRSLVARADHGRARAERHPRSHQTVHARRHRRDQCRRGNR